MMKITLTSLQITPNLAEEGRRMVLPWGQTCHSQGPTETEEWMGWQQPYEIQEIQIKSPSPGKEETQHQDRAGTDWLGSSSDEKNLGVVMSNELNMTPLHAWQQGRTTASPQYRKDIDNLEQVQWRATKIVGGWNSCPMRRGWEIRSCSAWRRYDFKGNITAAC